MRDKDDNKVSVNELNESDLEKIIGGSGYEVDQEFVIGGGNNGAETKP